MIWKSDPNCPGRHSPNNLLLLKLSKTFASKNFLVILAFTDRLEKGRVSYAPPRTCTVCTAHRPVYFFKDSFLRTSLFLKNERLMNASLDKYINNNNYHTIIYHSSNIRLFFQRFFPSCKG